MLHERFDLFVEDLDLVVECLPPLSKILRRSLGASDQHPFGLGDEGEQIGSLPRSGRFACNRVDLLAAMGPALAGKRPSCAPAQFVGAQIDELADWLMWTKPLTRLLSVLTSKQVHTMFRVVSVVGSARRLSRRPMNGADHRDWGVLYRVRENMLSFDPLGSVDYVVNDPPFNDPEFPPEHFMTHFLSAGSVVHAFMWIAQGRDHKGCVIICPQAYGGDRLDSLILPLLSSGISVMTFHPRGMWDGQHRYTSISAIDDACAAVEFVRSADALGKTSLKGHAYRIDPDRIVLLGLSGGGGMVSLATCAATESVLGAVGIAPSNHELYRGATLGADAQEALNRVKVETAGRVDTVERMLAMTDADFDRTSIIHNVPKLLSRPVLLVGADRDVTTPVATCHAPIANAFREAGAQRFTEVVMEADHQFLTKRIALARLVISWLQSECGM